MLNPVKCTRITGQQKSFTVLVETTDIRFPFNSTSIAFIPVQAITLGEAGKKAVESVTDNPAYNRLMNSRPVIRAYYE